MQLCLSLYLKQPTLRTVWTHTASWFRLDDKLIASVKGTVTSPRQGWNSTSLYLPKVRLCKCFSSSWWLGQNFSKWSSRIGRSSGPKTVLWATCSNLSRTFTWLLQCTQSCLNGSNTHFSLRLPERAFWEIQCLQHATLSPPTSCILYSSLATLEEAIQSILRLLNVLRSETNFDTKWHTPVSSYTALAVKRFACVAQL